MSVMEQQWNTMDHTHWPEYNDVETAAYNEMWWSQQSYFEHMECPYVSRGYTAESASSSTTQWKAFQAQQEMDDAVEDWMSRVPKFPPPTVPAPIFQNSGLSMFDDASSEHQEPACMLAEAIKPPPGLEASVERSRPPALGVLPMMELAATLENKDPFFLPHTPATTAPPTPASSLTELNDALSLPPTPASQDWWNPRHVSPSIAPAGPKLTLPSAVGGAARVVSLEALVQGESSKALWDPVQGEMEELGFTQPSFWPTGLPAPPPGLDLPVQLAGGGSTTPGGSKTVKSPPGLELNAVAEFPEVESELHSMCFGTSTPAKALESVSVESYEVDGVPCLRAVWRIVHLRGRLKTSLGKPLVSPPFTVGGLSELRFMITPDAKGTLEGLRGKSKQSHFTKMLTNGPLHCSIKLKVPELPPTSTTTFKFYLTVGSTARYGPYTSNFKEHTMHGCNDTETDWLKEVDAEGSICVALEMFGEV